MIVQGDQKMDRLNLKTDGRVNTRLKLTLRWETTYKIVERYALIHILWTNIDTFPSLKHLRNILYIITQNL